MYLPFEHAESLHRLIIVSVSVLRYQWILAVQGPPLSKGRVIRFLVQPSQRIITAIAKVLSISLNLQDRGNIILYCELFYCSLFYKEICPFRHLNKTFESVDEILMREHSNGSHPTVVSSNAFFNFTSEKLEKHKF